MNPARCCRTKTLACGQSRHRHINLAVQLPDTAGSLQEQAEAWVWLGENIGAPQRVKGLALLAVAAVCWCCHDGGTAVLAQTCKDPAPPWPLAVKD